MHVGPTLQHDCFNVSCLLRNNVVINEKLMRNFAGEILDVKYLYLFSKLVEYIKMSQKAATAFCQSMLKMAAILDCTMFYQ